MVNHIFGGYTKGLHVVSFLVVIVTTATTVTSVTTLTTVSTVTNVTSFIVKYQLLVLLSSKVNFFTKSYDRQADQPTTRSIND